MLGNIKTVLGLLLFKPKLLFYYFNLLKSDVKSREVLVDKQVCDLNNMVAFCYEHVPYYKQLFEGLNLKPSDIKTLSDLQKIPILTKSQIISAGSDMYPISDVYPYKLVSTGGSTGEPMKYRISKNNSLLSLALLMRGWNRAGYNIGDRVLVFAGGSLVNDSDTIAAKFRDYILNFKKVSSYGVNDVELQHIVCLLNEWKPFFFRGYASSILIFCEFLNDKNITLLNYPKAVITTSEMLLSQQRTFIESVLKCKVYDSYGLNDGGLTAFECIAGNGYHIDTERAILEVVDDYGNQSVGKKGKILATTLSEKSMPLLRYDTGDNGVLDTKICSCKKEQPILKELKGRETDYLIFNDKKIASPVLTVLMGTVEGVIQYQFVQEDCNSLDIYLKVNSNFSKEEQECYICKSLERNVGKININFEYKKDFHATTSNKHKFIIRKI